MRRLLSPVVLLALAAPALAAAPRTVVVLLFDGFAPSMFAGANTPALDRMRREGAWTNRFVPPFPTISLISGMTISTGCWPEHHGVVTNIFLDPVRGRYDHSRDADWLTGCEHMHQAAERQGVRSAALDWYGAMSTSKGAQATVARDRKWEEMPDDLAKADEVVALLNLPDAERPRLILAYFKGPDGVAHRKGIGAEETRAAVEHTDAAVAKVQRAVESAPFPVALIVTTDHGMRYVSHIVNVRKILANHQIKAEPLSTGTTSFLYFENEADVAPAAEKLADYEEFEVLRKGALPGYAHLGDGARVPQLILSAKPPYFIEDPALWPPSLKWLGTYGPEIMWARLSLKASHGYPPQEEGMAGILYASGDGIAKGREVREMNAVDLHPTVMSLLGVEPGRPVDGTVARELLAE